MAAHIFVLCKSSYVIIHAFVLFPLLEAAFIGFARWIPHISGINLHGPSECSQLHLIKGRTREGDSDWEERLRTRWPRQLILIRQNEKATFRSHLLRTSNARILMCFAKSIVELSCRHTDWHVSFMQSLFPKIIYITKYFRTDKLSSFLWVHLGTEWWETLKGKGKWHVLLIVLKSLNLLLIL